MALSASDLVSALKPTLNMTTTTAEITAYANGIVAALTGGTFSHALVTGTAPSSSGPLTLGAAALGVMVLNAALMEAYTVPAFVGSTSITSENAAIIGYLQTGTVTFAPGGITGICTNTPTSPGPLTNGAGSGGTIIGLSGSGALGAVSAALGGIGPLGAAFYSALIGYISANATGSYASGAVNATCPAGGGPITLGVGVGGVIS